MTSRTICSVAGVMRGKPRPPEDFLGSTTAGSPFATLSRRTNANTCRSEMPSSAAACRAAAREQRGSAANPPKMAVRRSALAEPCIVFVLIIFSRPVVMISLGSAAVTFDNDEHDCGGTVPSRLKRGTLVRTLSHREIVSGPAPNSDLDRKTAQSG